MKDAIVVFDDFSGGDYGRDWAGTDAENKFRAVNVVEYPGGWIGPRPPLVEFTLPEGTTPDPDEMDPDVVVTFGDNDRAIWFADNDYLVTSDGYIWNVLTGQRSWDQLADVELLADYAVTPFGNLYCVSLDSSVQPHGVIRQYVNGDSDTAPSFFLLPDLGIVPVGAMRTDRYSDTIVAGAFRVFYWTDGLTGNDLQYDALNVSDVYVRAIYDIIEQKNTLVLITGSFEATEDLDDAVPNLSKGTPRPLAEVYVIYGALGADATLRKVDSGPEPAHTDTGAYVWTTAGDNVFWINQRRLVRFDGAEVVALPAPLPRVLPDANFDYGPDSFADWWTAVNGTRQGEQILATALTPTTTLPDGESDFLRKGVFVWSPGGRGEIWTAHDPGIEFHADEAEGYEGAGLAKRGNGSFYVYPRTNDRVVFVTGGSTDATYGEPPRLYQMSTDLSFPDTSQNDGDTSAPVVADFYTHDYWDPQGREIYVEGITVDYAYTAGDEADCHFTAEVESLQLYDDAAPRGGGEVNFTVPTSGTPSEPGSAIIRGRVDLPCRSAGSGNGFRVHISDWSGVAIRRITANIRFTGGR